MPNTVELMATLPFIRAHLNPDFTPPTQFHKEAACADFPIDPAACKTALGHWLATHISTTRITDNGSRCQLLLPSTLIGLSMRAKGEELAQRQELTELEQAEKVLASMERWITRQRQQIQEKGPSAFKYSIELFHWPVIGSSKMEGVNDAAAYFDACGKMIRHSKGVILRAGASDAELPVSLLRTMGKGKDNDGVQLLERYRRQQALEQAAKMPKAGAVKSA